MMESDTIPYKLFKEFYHVVTDDEAMLNKTQLERYGMRGSFSGGEGHYRLSIAQICEVHAAGGRIRFTERDDVTTVAQHIVDYFDHVNNRMNNALNYMPPPQEDMDKFSTWLEFSWGDARLRSIKRKATSAFELYHKSMNDFMVTEEDMRVPDDGPVEMEEMPDEMHETIIRTDEIRLTRYSR